MDLLDLFHFLITRVVGFYDHRGVLFLGALFYGDNLLLSGFHLDLKLPNLLLFVQHFSSFLFNLLSEPKTFGFFDSLMCIKLDAELSKILINSLIFTTYINISLLEVLHNLNLVLSNAGRIKLLLDKTNVLDVFFKLVSLRLVNLNLFQSVTKLDGSYLLEIPLLIESVIQLVYLLI